MLNYITYKFFNNENPLFTFKICFIFLFFFFRDVFCFLLHYFLILFNKTSAIFECPSCISMSLIIFHNSTISSFLLQCFTVLTRHFSYVSFVICTIILYIHTQKRNLYICICIYIYTYIYIYISGHK